MAERTIETKMVVTGAEEYRSEIAAIQASIADLGTAARDTAKNIAQLNEELRKLVELHKQAPDL